jgi:hypothetical protein
MRASFVLAAEIEKRIRSEANGLRQADPQQIRPSQVVRKCPSPVGPIGWQTQIPPLVAEATGDGI